ncbi:hypothetical protein [Rhodocytophaga rosea]|uniref:hypothetical protein n=1 Tax=Rhodocytophaga rosea TaxID=2704465 RepID=UPI0018D6C094|nr:hypothetical protein [Rhodocytophaga rosea]
MTISTTRLWRPVGLKELRLIFDSGYKSYPPRLYWQPIFYPVTNFAYAEQITREWNVPSNGDHCGFVTEFDINRAHLAQYQEQNVGGTIHNEYWIPAEELEAFNDKITGDIRVVASRYSADYKGISVEKGILSGKNIWEQLSYLESVIHEKEHIKAVFAEAEYAVLTNLGFWKQFAKEKEAVVNQLIEVWREFRPAQGNNYL